MRHPCRRHAARIARLVAAASLLLAGGVGAVRLPPSPGGAQLLARYVARLSEDLADAVFGFVPPMTYEVASVSGRSSSVTLWGAEGQRHVLAGHAAPVTGVEFFPLEGRLLSWSGIEGLSIVWDTGTGEPLHRLRHHSAVAKAGVLPCGRRVVACGGTTGCTVWDASSGDTVGFWQAPAVSHFEALTADRVFMWSVMNASVWDVDAVERVCQVHGTRVVVAAAFPDGDLVVTGNVGMWASVLDASTCEVVQEVDVDWPVAGVAVIGGGVEIVTVDTHGNVVVWGVASAWTRRQLVSGFHPLSFFADRLAPFPHDRRIVTFNEAELTVWDSASGEALHRFVSFPTSTRAAAVAPGGDLLVACGSLAVTVYDARRWTREHAFHDGGLVEASLEEALQPCVVAVGPGRAFDPVGIGSGAPWQRLAK